MNRDGYDLAHEETGSGNISKATPEWKQILTRARTEPSDEQYVLHRAYQLVNEEVKAGIPWSKCMNCGCPFRGSGEFCDGACELQEVIDRASAW